MPPSRSLRIRGVSYPVRLPSLRDPRLHLAATITSIQVMGQAFLGWELSIAQILVALLTCALIETPMVFWERREIVWPASALLTGNGVALVLRVNGTEHGDWWSMNGWYIFAATSGLALLSKHLLRFRGRPVINPSNLGLVVCFLLLGTSVVNPLDFWWGPMSVSMAVVYSILAVGALTVTRRLGLLPMSLAFWGTFTASLGVVAASGHCISARWSVTPVCGTDFWWIVVTSPEVLIFMLFMITDPMTSPSGFRPRMFFGATVGLTSALLVAPMQTEFGAKVAVLSGLVAVCVLRPLVAMALERVPQPSMRLAPVAFAAVVPLAVSALVLAGLPADSPAMARTTIAAGALDGRPDVTIPDGALPAITISDDVASVVGDRATLQADEMARDLMEALMIEADAAATNDAALAASAIAGQRLEEFPQGSLDERLEFSAMEVVLVRDPADPQAVPRFGIHASRQDGSAPLDSIFVLEEADGTWLLTEEQEPESS